ncbi:MAG TPA: MBL fold metallo-hydrolase, partial [Dehalococcoidia bacterium]|nr:MBL fold metallo-hydrolase [Dehalococcoidia bacterium]
MAEPQVNELIVRGIVVGVFAENCWIIGSRRTGEAVVIDPGDQPQEILALARDMGVRIKLIANSHGHVDHVLGVRGVQAATGARFLLHPLDLPVLRGAATRLPWSGPVEPPPDPDAFLSDGDEVEVAGVKLKVMHTPGHTQGSVSFYSEGMLFCGDTLFQGSIGRTDFPGGSHEQEMASIVDRLLTLPDDTIVLPGHMGETRIGIERQI